MVVEYEENITESPDLLLYLASGGLADLHGPMDAKTLFPNPV